MARAPAPRPRKPPRHQPPVNRPGAGRVNDPRDPPRPTLVASAAEVVAQLRQTGVDPKVVIGAGAARVLVQQFGPPVAGVFATLCTVECLGLPSLTFFVLNATGGPQGSIRPVWQIEDQQFTDDTIAPIALVAGASVRITLPAHGQRIGLQGRSDALAGGVPALFTVAVGFVR